MSTRTSILADPNGKSKEIAEGMYGIPLLWIPLISSEEVEAQLDLGMVEVKRSQAVSRLIDSVPFLTTLLNRVEELEDWSQQLLQHLKKSKSKTLGFDLNDPLAMDGKNFSDALLAATFAIAAQEPSTMTKVGRKKYTLTELLCLLSTLDIENGIVEEEQCIGMLW